MSVYFNNSFLCDQGFCINLPRRTDRKQSILSELEKINLTGIEFFDGIEIKEEEFSDMGCTESHLSLMRIQVENKIPYILVIEDDAESCWKYNRSLAISDDSKKIQYSKDLIKSFYEIKPDLLFMGTKLDSPVTYINKTVSFCSTSLASSAYVIGYDLSKFIIENYHYKSKDHFSYKYPIDFFIKQIKAKNCRQILSNKNNQVIMDAEYSYIVSNCLIFNQSPGFSDITKQYTDYSQWSLDSHSVHCYEIIKNRQDFSYYL